MVAEPSGTKEQEEGPTANTGERDTVKEVNGSQEDERQRD